MGILPMVLEGFQDISPILRAGVYALCYHGAVVYIGKSKSLYARIYAHRSAWSRERQGKRAFAHLPVKGILFDEVLVFPARPDQIDELERAMIVKYSPKFNVLLKPPTNALTHIRVNGVPLTLTPAHMRLERRV